MSPSGSRPGASEDDLEGRSEVFRSNWPDPLADEAFSGPAGDFVRAVEPHSEADPAALLLQFLVGFGNLLGRTAHWVAEGDKHFTNLFAVIVGQTSKGRKGSAWGQAKRVLADIDPEWARRRVKTGLSSGEGLIFAVRDPGGEKEKRKRAAEDSIDPGELDKRLCVVEPEFSQVLKVAERQTNTISPVLRQAWDSPGLLSPMTKNDRISATDPHISIVGHITKDELRRLLTDTATGNGFANRFLWVCAKRSKLLPDGGRLEEADLAHIIERGQRATEFGASVGEIRRDEEAGAIWREVYASLSEGKPGLLGAVTSRAEAQTMRLACLYALLDRSHVVGKDQLRAALAVWRYCEDSARFIFGDALGDATADEILRELRQRPNGLSRNEIREHFNRNKSSAEIGRALGVLQEYGLARVVRECEQEGQIRPTERWHALRTPVRD